MCFQYFATGGEENAIDPERDTRGQINAMLGGGLQAFLPTKNERLVCGCFKLELNPKAPSEVWVGFGPQREASAKVAVLQQTPILIFLMREIDAWEYLGNYRATRYLEGNQPQPGAGNSLDVFAGILYLESAST